ncbi:hypothetical protein Tdes44962_MAKER03056, partial [Teratosphaeria destructans]
TPPILRDRVRALPIAGVGPDLHLAVAEAQVAHGVGELGGFGVQGVGGEVGDGEGELRGGDRGGGGHGVFSLFFGVGGRGVGGRGV